MLINNYPHLACHTQIEEFHSRKITVKPLPNLPIIKDLVADLTPMFNNHKSVKPYLIRHDKEEMESPTAQFAQLPRELNEFLQFTYCIKCGICVSACPTSASDKLFLGPQAMAQCYHYCADSRDGGEQERLPMVSSDHGVWNCHLAGACSEACP
jgi:succinate dehydrogenase / fumarate reductase iron-sulfur subunit